MDKKYLIEKLKELAAIDDPEMAHGEADDLICTFLTDLGHSDVVEAYENIEKWYA